ncbi:MAG: efflux RND transporter periplasmic adaptor subunit [Armatimonadota bacterium]
MQRKKWRGRWIVLVLVVAIAGVAAFVIVRRNGEKKPEIRTAAVERGAVTISVTANGVLQPLTTVDVKSNVGGQVTELAVDEGDRVHAGQLIARIDPADTLTALEQQQADLSAARAKVNQSVEQRDLTNSQNRAAYTAAQEAVNAARQRLASAQETARVQPQLSDASIKQAESSLASAKATLEQTKSALIPQKLASAQASFDQAKANATYAEKDLGRQQSLLAKGFVSQGVVDAAQQRYAVAKAALETSRKQLDTVKDETAQDLRSAQARVDQAAAALRTAQANQSQDTLKQHDVVAAQAALKQAEAQLASAKAGLNQDRIRQGDITQAQSQMTRTAAAVKNAQTTLGYTTIIAPRAGVVIAKYVDVGSIIAAGRSSVAGTGAGVSIVQIADTTRMFVQCDVDETDIAQIAVGQPVDITVDAYPNELFDGKVTKIAPQAKVNQNVTTITVTVEIDMPDTRLKPTMNASCEFITDRRVDVLLAPNEAIQETDDGATVQVMDGEKLVTRKVEVGLQGNDNSEIISGLKEGDKVVTSIIDPEAATPSGSSGGQSRMGGRRPGMGMGGFH